MCGIIQAVETREYIKNNFILWLHQVSVEARRIFAASCGIFCWGAQPLQLWCVGSVVVACMLSCSMAHGALVPQPGIELTSLALQGVFLTAGPPENSPLVQFLSVQHWYLPVMMHGAPLPRMPSQITCLSSWSFFVIKMDILIHRIVVRIL